MHKQITLLFLLIILTTCRQSPPLPPQWSKNDVVVFKKLVNNSIYTLPKYQAEKIIAFLNSGPCKIIEPNKSNSLNALPTAFIIVGKDSFEYHAGNSITYEDAKGRVFIWEHPFFELLYTASDQDLSVPFQSMDSYPWPSTTSNVP